MKSNIIYTVILAFLAFQNANSQIACYTPVEVELDADGEALVPISDLVVNIEFLLTQGTVTYYIYPSTSGEIQSGEELISLDCQNISATSFIVELTDNGDLVSNCWGTLEVTAPNGGCGSTPSCENPAVDCSTPASFFAAYSSSTFVIPANNFAVCSNALNCTGTYEVAIGSIANVDNLDFMTSISTDQAVDYKTPVVLAYTENGTTVYKQTNLYVWDLLDCVVVTTNSTSVSLSTDATATISGDMFVAGIACDDLLIGLPDTNGNEPADFFQSITVNCDNLGFSEVYIKDASSEMIASTTMYLSDPLEACGIVLGPGDKVIHFGNNPPSGTFLKTEVTLNGNPLPKSPIGKGWIMNENDLASGENILSFDTGNCTLNGISTLDLVIGLRIIINDILENPLDAIVFDLDQSGYNGIGDLLAMREMIVGISNGQGIPNALFIPQGFMFPNDFNPFDFDYDFTSYTFNSADFENLSFSFEVYKVGDLSGNAITEDGLKSNEIISTRSLDKFEISDMEVSEGETFTFIMSYDEGIKFKGLLAALVSDGIKFTNLSSSQGSEVYYNVLNDNEIRINYLSSNPLNSIDKISFAITGTASKAGKLIDLLGLKHGFPQEVIDENNAIIAIEDLEEETTVSISEPALDNDVSVFPNPAQHLLKLELKDAQILEVLVIDIMGKVVARQTANTGQVLIDVSGMPQGLFFLDITTSSGNQKSSFMKI